MVEFWVSPTDQENLSDASDSPDLWPFLSSLLSGTYQVANTVGRPVLCVDEEPELDRDTALRLSNPIAFRTDGTGLAWRANRPQAALPMVSGVGRVGIGSHGGVVRLFGHIPLGR